MKFTQKLGIKYIRLKFKALSFISKRKTAEQAFKLFCTPMFKSATKKPTIFKWAENLQFKVNGTTVKGYRWNHKRPHRILILHGFSSSAFKFNTYIAPLLEKGYEVIAFDAPAHGNSGGSSVNAVEYADMIVKIIKMYGPINGFLAHSFGGIAVALALEKTKHDASTKVVLIAPATETSTAVDSAFEMLQIKDADIRKEFDNIILEKSGYHTKWFSIKRAMQHIKASVLWIHDKDDDITPLDDALKVKEKNFANVQFVITEGLGHRRIYRDEKVKKMVIDFL